MVKLPGPLDVQTINPKIQRGPLPDTSVTKPGVIGNAIEGFGESLGNLADTVAKVHKIEAEKQQRLIDGTAITEGQTNFDKAVGSEWARAQGQEDFSNPDTLNNYSKFLDKTSQDTLGNAPQNMSPEARLRLQAQLAQMRVNSYQQAEILHLAQTKQRANDAVNERANAIAGDAYRVPESFPDAFANLDSTLDNFTGLTPEQKHNVRTAGQIGIVDATAKGFADQGKYDSAKSFVNDSKFDAILKPDHRAALVNAIEEKQKVSETAARIEQDRVRVALERAKKEAGDTAANDFISHLITEPTKVKPADIAANPNLTYEQKHLLFDFQNARLKTEGADEKQGPGFWQAYQGVMAAADDPKRITAPMEIYRRVGPKGDLTLPAAQKLTELLKQRQAGESKGDFETQSLAEFYKSAHGQIVDPYGFKMDGGEEANYRFFMDTHKLYEDGKAKGLSPQQMLTPTSPDYIGKNMQAYVPKLSDDTLLDKPAAPKEPFSLHKFDNTIATGLKGRDAGVKAMIEAVKAGNISKENAARYAITRGWALPPKAAVATPTGPQVPPVMH